MGSRREAAGTMSASWEPDTPCALFTESGSCLQFLDHGVSGKQAEIKPVGMTT